MVSGQPDLASIRMPGDNNAVSELGLGFGASLLHGPVIASRLARFRPPRLTSWRFNFCKLITNSMEYIFRRNDMNVHVITSEDVFPTTHF